MKEADFLKAKEMLEQGASLDEIKEVLSHANVNPKEVDEIIHKLANDESGKKKGLLEKYKKELRKGRSLNEIDSMLKKEGISKELRIELLKELEIFEHELKKQPDSSSQKPGNATSPENPNSGKSYKWVIYLVIILVIAVILYFIFRNGDVSGSR